MLTSAIDPVLIALIALLPKDGAPMSVSWLAKTVDITEPKVTNLLFQPWADGCIGYDRPSDSYFLKKAPL